MTDSERARLFVALELPDRIRKALVAWRDAAVGDTSVWRPVASAALHVTLCFLGDQPVGEIDAIASAFAAPLADAAPTALAAPPAPRLAVDTPLLLPPRRPRVLAVGLADPSGALAALQRRLAQALTEGGWYEPEPRRYLAHVTVARSRSRWGGGRVAASPAAMPAASIPPPPALSFTATAVSLLRSRLGGEGPRYERLAGVSLAPGAAAR